MTRALSSSAIKLKCHDADFVLHCLSISFLYFFVYRSLYSELECTRIVTHLYITFRQLSGASEATHYSRGQEGTLPFLKRVERSLQSV